MASIVANPNMDPETEASKLYHAMKGKGCDEEAIIKILTSVDEKQREQIKYQFNKIYGDDLVEVLKKELKGNLETAILGLMVPRRQYTVQEIKAAFKGMGVQEENLIDLLITSSNGELMEIMELYRNCYGEELVDEVRKALKGAKGLQSVLLAILAADRDIGKNDSKIANRAQELKAALYDSKWNEESAITYIFNKSSFEDLKQIADVFCSQTGQNLEHIIQAKTKSHFQTVTLAILRAAQSIPGYFAERLSDAMEGRGCDEKTLIRILLMRAEVDMMKIKEEFKKKFGRTLYEAIHSEIKGDLRLLALLLIK